ncbi:MAG TPA: tRNA (adenosine(37)-N6)-threonylcarbamoyltransferase complex ATPase subunit type 1 TsaE [Syntrophales bacterium]|nr:tRNA (adenosine(37)-N6)-threonylcarbamoyltransferase complex ATPase subunit type 1 TsaE [Syntrophales bacterium]
MTNFTFISHGPQETYAFGKNLGETLFSGDVVALSGELGTGKTCLAQGIARGLGVPEEYKITSPTFTIINEYPGRLILYHLDVYRLSGTRDLEEIGYDECFNDKGVVIVEWAEKIRDALPKGTLFVLLTYLDENRRKIMLSDNPERIT